MSSRVSRAAAAGASAATTTKARASRRPSTVQAASASAAAAAEEDIPSHRFVTGLKLPFRRQLSTPAEPKEVPARLDPVAAARKAARLRLPSLVKRAHRHERLELLKRQRVELSVHLESYDPKEFGGKYPDSDEYGSEDGLSLPESNETPPAAEKSVQDARLRLPRVIKRSHRIQRTRLLKRQRLEFATMLKPYTHDELDGKYSEDEWCEFEEEDEKDDEDDEEEDDEDDLDGDD